MRIFLVRRNFLLPFMSLIGLGFCLPHQAINAMQPVRCICEESGAEFIDDADENAWLSEIVVEPRCQQQVKPAHRLNYGIRGACSQMLKRITAQYPCENILPTVIGWVKKYCMPCDKTDEREKALLSQAYDAWLARQNSNIESKIKGDKLDLRCQHLAFVAMFGPAAHEQLHEINLQSNDLTVPGISCLVSCAPFENMTKLNLANNHLDRLPAHFFVALPSCRRLSVANNQIECIETDALKGANDCWINLCGNPLKIVEPGAMTVGFNTLDIFCSKGLPREVIAEMRNQLFTPDLQSKALIKAQEISHKLSSREGCMPIFVIVCVAPVCTVFVLAILILMHTNPFSFKAICSNTGAIAAGMWLFQYLARKSARRCEIHVIKNGNQLIEIDHGDEKRVQNRMFES